MIIRCCVKALPLSILITLSLNALKPINIPIFWLVILSLMFRIIQEVLAARQAKYLE